MKLWVGTSGYSYKQWEGTFYPEHLPAKEMLSFYASKLGTVEINNTFYRFPKEAILASWYKQVPADFRFVLKAPRKITHEKRLKNVEEEVAYLIKVSSILKTKLGALLFQLPPNFKKDLDKLQNFLSLLPDGTPASFEFRHPSWFDDAVFTSLREHNCALCVADSDDLPDDPRMVSTATWGYLRLRRNEYSRTDLSKWKKRILEQPWEHTFVYFKHEDAGLGPKLAAQLLEATPR